MIKAVIIIIILFIIFFLVTSIINKNKFLYKIPNKSLYGVLIIFLLALLIFFRVINDKNANGNYIPAKIEGNKIIPGKVEYDK